MDSYGITGGLCIGVNLPMERKMDMGFKLILNKLEISVSGEEPF